MANLGVDGLDGLVLDLEAVSELPDNVAEEMLTAEAKIVEEAQVYQGMVMGVYDKRQGHIGGTTLRSIGHGKMKRTNDGSRTMYVYPQGKNERGVRNAEVAFINEFGKRGQAARPFIKTANEEAADSAVNAAANVYDKFLKSKNL